MRAATLTSPRAVLVTEVPDPTLVEPGDALVEVVASCICGSDLWPYRGIHPTQAGQRLGHEFVGTVREVGPAVRSVRPGQFVI